MVGVIGNEVLAENRFPSQRVGEKNLRAVAEVAGALPLMFAGCPDITEVDALLDLVDGILLTGGRANVHPTHFGAEPNAKHEPYDTRRDAVALAVAVACVTRGVPLLGICRGLQEMNVAFGGTLHPEIRELPGRVNHRMPRLDNGEIHPDHEVVFGDRHDVKLVPGGAFAKLFGKDIIRVNSLHGQGILEPGARVVVEGVADDYHDRGDPDCRRAGFCARRAVARGVRPAAQPDQPRAVPGVRRGGGGATAGPVT